MHIFSWLSKGTSLLYFLPSIILLIVVILVCVRIYLVIFLKALSPKIFKIFLIPVVLLGLGFYEFFRAFFILYLHLILKLFIRLL